MVTKKSSPSPKTNWAYAYQIVPPQTEGRLRAIKGLLDNEHRAAQRGARTWTARLVSEQQITHILVVSDSPAQDREVNRRLEATLKELNVRFSVTTPMAVVDDVVPSPRTNGSQGPVTAPSPATEGVDT
jgi:hypothetical protein